MVSGIADRTGAVLRAALDSDIRSAGVEAACRQGLAVLGESMRVAMVGQIKMGKSTLVNALLGGHLVATGATELTAKVTELRWAEEHSPVVHYRDDRPPEPWPAQRLDEVTTKGADLALLDSISHVVIGYPNELLHAFALVDSPGLDGRLSDEDVKRLLGEGMSSADVEDLQSTMVADAESAIARADAAVFVVDRASIGEQVRTLAAAFGGVGGHRLAGPLNTIAIINRPEMYWPRHGPDPLVTGRTIIDDERKRYPEIDEIFFDAVPVCGLLAEGAQTLTGDHLETLTDLAHLPRETLEEALDDFNFFCFEEFDDVPVPPERRSEIAGRIHTYGVHLACELIRDGVDDPVKLRQPLLDASGLPQLRTLLIDHFGNRAGIIKADRVIGDVHAAIKQVRIKAGPNEPGVERVAGLLQGLETQEAPGFRELRILRALYNGELDRLTPDEREEILRVTGEQGGSVGARVGWIPGRREGAPGAGGPGQPDDVVVALREVIELAANRAAYWRSKHSSGATDPAVAETARQVGRLYDEVRRHARQALDHLELKDCSR